MRSLILAVAIPAFLIGQTPHRVKQLKIQVLSTMLVAETRGIGEWGFAAVVDVDGRRILFDTGAHPDTVLRNSREYGIDLSRTTDVILSHHHSDHTSGLVTLRKAVMDQNPEALSRVHAGEGIFRTGGGSRSGPDSALGIRTAYEQTGGKFLLYSKATELFPGVWITGPVPRKYPERNWSPPAGAPAGAAEDNIPEDLSLVFDTDQGLVILTGCGHAGIINTVDYANQAVRKAPLHAAIGGFHLFPLEDEKLNWTADRLKEFGLQNFLGAHCTGIEATYRIRERCSLSRKTCAVGGLGAVFELGKGIQPGPLAR